MLSHFALSHLGFFLSMFFPPKVLGDGSKFCGFFVFGFFFFLGGGGLHHGAPMEASAVSGYNVLFQDCKKCKILPL